MNEIKNFMLPEHFNELFKNEAISSISLTRDVVEKINELVNAYNELIQQDVQWKQTVEGKVNAGVVYMKDNLLNSLNNLMVVLRDSGFIEDRIDYHCSTLRAQIENLTANVTEGTSTFDTEIIDARVGVDSMTYKTLGQGIRQQLENLIGAITLNNMTIIFPDIKQGSIQSKNGKTVVATTTTLYSDFIEYAGELLYISFDENCNIQYFLYDENKNYLGNVSNSEDMGKRTGFIHVKHKNNNFNSDVRFMRFNLKYDNDTTIEPETVSLTLLRMVDDNHFYVNNKTIYDNLTKVSLNALNLVGAGIDNDGVPSASGIRQATQQFIECGVNANVFIKTKPQYQFRGYYYNSDGSFAEKVEGGLMDGGVNFISKFPLLKIVFSKKDDLPITNEEVYENCEIVVTKPDYSIIFNNHNLASAPLLSEIDDKMAHCSSIVTNGNKVYVGYYADKANNVEDIDKTSIKLMLCETDKFNSKHEHVTMCKVGDTFNGLSQVSTAPYDPTMWCVNNTIRMYFSGNDKTDGVILGFLTYPKTSTFTRCKISHGGTDYLISYAGLFKLYGALGFTTFNSLKLLHFSDFIKVDDVVYTTLCMDNDSSSLLLKTTDGITFEIVTVLNDDEHQREINGVIRNNVFYYAFRGTTGIYFNSYDIENDVQGEKTYIANASSKPMCFSTYFNDYFLLNTSGNRRSVTLYRLNDGELEQIHGFYDTHTFHYGSCVYDNDYCYMSYTTDDSKISSTQDRANIKLLKFFMF